MNGSGVEKSFIRTWLKSFPMTAPIPLFLNTGGVFIEFIYFRFWQLVVDPLPPQDAKNLEEHLGIERDTSEHAALEQGSLCQQKRKF